MRSIFWRRQNLRQAASDARPARAQSADICRSQYLRETGRARRGKRQATSGKQQVVNNGRQAIVGIVYDRRDGRQYPGGNIRTSKAFGVVEVSRCVSEGSFPPPANKQKQAVQSKTGQRRNPQIRPAKKQRKNEFWTADPIKAEKNRQMQQQQYANPRN